MKNISPRAGVVNRNLDFGRSFFADSPDPGAPISQSNTVDKPLPTNSLYFHPIYRDRSVHYLHRHKQAKKEAEAQDAKSERGAGNSNLGQHPTSAFNS
jgi:hypothetical protein